MKRLKWLFFAFAILFLLPGDVCAQFVVNSALINLTDNDGNGYANVGDTITISVQANNLVNIPTVNLGSIGLGTIPLAIQNGNTYSTVPLTLNFRPGNPATPNYNLESFLVSANYDDGDPLTGDPATTQQTVNATFFDLIQVQGTGATASLVGNTITITITDQRYQTGTTATVDLTPVGGAVNTPMNYIGGNQFQINYPLPAGVDYNGPFVITLNDPVNVHPPLTYVTNNLSIDNLYPTVDQGNTSVVIQSGNATAIPGDVLRITAAVTAYDNETVTVSCPQLTNPPANPSIAGGYVMPLITSSGPGNPAVWQIDVVLTDANLKNNSLPITFTFVDDFGNTSTTTRYVSIDLDEPNMVNSEIHVILPDTGLESSLVPPVATATCILEIVSTISVDIGPDPLTVTVDLSSIGGPTNQPMIKIEPTDTYKATFVINQGTLEDGTQHIFAVSARDTGGNLVAQATTPAVRIDSNPPVLTGAQLTADSAYINVGSTFTITCNVTGIENGSVSVDLSALGLGGPDVNQLSNIGGNTYRRSFILPASNDNVGYGVPGVVDEYRSFTVYANDTVFPGTVLGHVRDASTNAMMIDNEAPSILEYHSQYTHNLFPADDDGYCRIGDTVSFHARIASTPIYVTINMLNLGYGNMENMIASAAPTDGQSGWYDYVLPTPVATGTFNRVNNLAFLVTATDDAENAITSSILLNLDNKPVVPTGFDIEVTYQAGRTDTDPSIINLNKSLHFRVPVNVPIPDDHSNATIDLSGIGGTTAEVMNYGNGSYSIDFDALPTTFDSSGHRFTAIITDLSGNRNISQSNMYRVDCEPPVILSATVEQLTARPVAIIGDELRFEAEVTNNEGVLPTIDLSNIGGSSAQKMVSIGSNRFEYVATIATGTVDGVLTDWTIKAEDNDLNYVELNTNQINLDNRPIELADALTLLINGAPITALSKIKIGDILDFTLDISNPAGTEGPGLIDLTAVGGLSNAPMTFNAATTAYSLNFTATSADAEYTDYRFTATVHDLNSNMLKTQSAVIPVIDCQPVTFTSAGINIDEDNGDNPIAGIANIGDVLMVYASASAYIDAIASATIGSDTVDFATATMIYNPATDRHEASFDVEREGENGWGLLTGSTDTVYFKLSAIDDIGNLTQIPAQVSTFTIRNIEPEIDFANTQFELSPNRFMLTASGDLVYNLATDTVGDRLVASITFADGLPMHRAWLDFTELGSGTYEMSVAGDMGQTAAAGIPVSKFDPIEYSQKRIYMYAMDRAGNISVASKTFWIDNTMPELVSAEFDGETLKVNVSETFANLDYKEFEIVGSNPPPLNTPTYLNFAATAPANIIQDLTSFEITLDHEHQKEMAGWASTPIYLKVNNATNSSLTDLSGNELPSVNFYPITITDSLWREPAKITQFTMTHNWPNSITLDIFFTKDMEQASLVASNAVLLYEDIGYDFTAVDYTSGYVFQPADVAGISWPMAHHLRIKMSDDGRDWLARKIGTGSRQLRIASRVASKTVAYDSLGKPMDHIPTSAGIIAADNRPTPNFDFCGPPNAPHLDLEARTLVLTANDRLLLTTSDFNVDDSDDPQMGMPEPTNATRVNGFFNKAVLHDIDNGTSEVLELEALNIASNTVFANTTVNLKLTSEDFANIVAMFKANESPIWRMEIGAGAFTNIWGAPSNPYLPSGNPGAMQVTIPSGYPGPELVACAMSDKPPVSRKNADELEFVIELIPSEIDGTIIPLQPQIPPAVRIINQTDNSLISEATFKEYAERTVDGKLRAMYSFTNTAAFATNLQHAPARLEIDDITDVFGHTYSEVSSYAYNLYTRNDSVPEGYTDTASAPIVIDTQKPVVSTIVPGDFIGRIPVNSTFRVNFDEEMDTAFIPGLLLATDSATMGFSFSGWTATATALFTNNTAFTAALPNGIWYYKVSGGQDTAGNTHDGTPDNAFPVQVRTYAPEVSPGNITFRTVQSNISSEMLTEQPWASYLDDGIFSIEYDVSATLFLPHYLEIFDANTNTRLGRTTIFMNPDETMATATFRDVDFLVPTHPGATGPTNYSVRVIDSASNETETITTIVYDNLEPDVATFTMTGIGSSTPDTWYYRPSGGNFNLNVITNTTTDPLRLAVYSFSDNATETYLLNTGTLPGTYNLATGTFMTNGTYKLTIVDLAGNIGTGPSSKKLVVDKDAPTVLAIYPDDVVGNAPTGGQTFRVIFSEKMDASATEQPVLTLTDFSTTINMNWGGWADPLVATTAIYTNAVDITPAMAPGTYTYRVTGGLDLAHNALIEPSDGDFEVDVQSEGPQAHIDVVTLQPHIYNSTPLNLGFSPDYGDGSATLRINYSAGPFNTPHNLRVYNSSNNQIGTFTPLPIGDSIEVEFSGTTPGWLWIAPHPDDGEYFFKIADNAGNVPSSNLVNSIIVDTASPTINSFAIESVGTATDTGAGLTYYYSSVAPATFSVTTTTNDRIRLMLTTDTATYTAAMSGAGTGHQVLYGNGLPEGAYNVTIVDIAGNYDNTNTYPLIIDSSPPQVNTASPTIMGGVKAGMASFDFGFNEHMNTEFATPPTAWLATDGAVIDLTFSHWTDEFTARFTNTENLEDDPTDKYSFFVTGARDLAGNPNVELATGQFEIEMFITPPDFDTVLRSQQQLISSGTELIDQPFSPFVLPGVATLSLSYNEGPFQIPHSILIYDSANNQVASVAINPDVANSVATTTVNAGLFGSPGTVGPATYSFRLIDNIGNLSATSTKTLAYDGLAPTVTVATFTGISDAIASPVYYNDLLHGDFGVYFESTANDKVRLILADGVATHTYPLTEGESFGVRETTLAVAETSVLPEGIYILTVADMAGNFAIGPQAITPFIVDRTAPVVSNVDGDEPMRSSLAGQATFTITFNEPMNQLASANPSLTLATTSKSIDCSFDTWLTPTQARFVSAEAITIDIPQGDYFCAVTAWDITGNKVATSTADVIEIRSRGPVISSVFATSFQSTTATDSAEVLTDKPFSFNVDPGAATLSVRLAQSPDTTPLHIHFMKAGATVASYTLVDGVDFDPVNNAATFTWSASNGPVPAGPTTYTIRLADDSGDFSIESYDWRMDASAPVALMPVITRGELATDAVYFNPLSQGYITVKFGSTETEAPKMRVRSANSTDTYSLSLADTNVWRGDFEGRFSRGADPKQLMPDGIYHLDMVDRAGNVALLASGDPILYDIIIDTQSPVVSSYSTKISGVPVTMFSPGAGNLEIMADTTEPLDATGIWYMDVLNSSGIRINRLSLSNVGGKLTAYWDGTDSAGNLVIDGNYTFRAADYTGNHANTTTTIYAMTTEFKILGSSQISSASVKIWFNHDVDPTSLPGTIITSDPALTITNISLVEGQAISFDVNPAFTHETSYTFAITPGTIKNIFGATLTVSNSTTVFEADGEGPVLTEVNFEDLTGQYEFKVLFNETYKTSSAGDKNNYSLTGPEGAVEIAQVTTQSDKKTVLITAATNLIENADYEISVTNIEDVYGNISPAANTKAFKGRDLTPPELTVSAFSNPANEYDIIVVVVSNEELTSSPELQVAQNNAPVISTLMQQGTDPLSYMIGITLSSSYPGNGELTASAVDLAGNHGSGNTTFAIAYLSANQKASVKSADKTIIAEFAANSLKEDALLKIFAHKLEKPSEDSSTIKTAMQHAARLAMNIRASADNEIQNQSELVPVTYAYEVSIPANKIDQGFNMFMEIPSATETMGLGLFYQKNDTWQHLSSRRTRGSKFAAKVRSSQLFAILKDTKAPDINLDASIDLGEPFTTAKPEFTGLITDAGSGIDVDSVSAYIDAGPAQPVQTDPVTGNFTFRPLADLTGGRHDLVIKAADKTGNQTQTAAIRFEVKVPLSITQIIQYPNPARNRAFIRISANRGDVGEDLIKVKIYDVSGHRVTTLYGIRATNEKWGFNARYLYDIPWDLRNSSGKMVANGVYFAKIELRDPDNPAKKVKETFKIAVLR